MNVLETLAQICAQLLRDDDTRVMLGEDVRDGGMLGLSRACVQDPEIRHRLLATPLSNAGLFAHAAGLSLGGRKPIVALSSSGALLEGLAHLRELATLSWRSGGALRPSMTLLAPSGPGFGLGGEASLSPESMLAELPGVRVLVPGGADRAPPLVRAAVEIDEGITIVLLPRSMMLEEVGAEISLETEHGIELQKAQQVRQGDAATVFCWGATVQLATLAADRVDASVEIVDLQCLSPLDENGLIEAAKKTGKLVIVHSGARSHGLGAELAARFADAAILSLDAPVLRVTGDRGPFDGSHEYARLPSVEAIADALSDVIHY